MNSGDHASHDIMYFGMKKAFNAINVVSEEESEEEKPVNFQIEYSLGFILIEISYTVYRVERV